MADSSLTIRTYLVLLSPRGIKHLYHQTFELSYVDGFWYNDDEPFDTDWIQVRPGTNYLIPRHSYNPENRCYRAVECSEVKIVNA